MNHLKQSSRIVELDVLRAIAVLLVIGRHFPPEIPAKMSSSMAFVIRCWIRTGWIGVDLFFVLSGFLVSGLLFREHLDKGKIDFKRFLIRRGLKIYPAFYIMTLVTACLLPFAGIKLHWADFLLQFFFLQNYFHVPGIWGHCWSLAVEEHFYFFLAMLFWALFRLKRNEPLSILPGLILGLGIICLCLRIYTSFHQPYSHRSSLYPTHLRIDSLAFGVWISYLYWLKPEKMAACLSHRALFAAVGLIALGTMSGLEVEQFFMHTVGLTVLYLAFAALLISLVPAPGSSPKLARWPLRIMAYIGEHSYSIYLWHLFVLVACEFLIHKIAGSDSGYLPICTLYFLGSIFFGIVAAKLIEIPFLRLRDRLFPGLSSKSDKGLDTHAPRAA